MSKTLTLALVLAALAAVVSGPVAASPARIAAACPPGTTDRNYCEVVSVRLGISPVKGQKLAAVLNKGFKVNVSCPSDCVLTVYGTVPKKTAAKFHAAAATPKIVAKGTKALPAPMNWQARVKFTKKAKMAFLKAYKAKKLKKLTLGLTMTARNKAGAKKTLTSRITFK